MTLKKVGNNNKQNPQLTKSDVIFGAAILIGAQLACASTASCVHALPLETPSVLRGLWRQTLTSLIFGSLALVLLLVKRYWQESSESADSDKERLLTSPSDAQPAQKSDIREDDAPTPSSQLAHIVLVTLAVVGAALLNDTIVIALEYASSAAVMCLCNTTPIWLILYAIIYCGAETPAKITVAGAGISLVGAIICATAEGGDDSEGSGPKNESLGAIYATLAALAAPST